MCVQDFNARTDKFRPDVPIPVVLTAYENRTFDFVTKTPPTSWFLHHTTLALNEIE